MGVATALRARVLTPLAQGGWSDDVNGMIAWDEQGKISRVGAEGTPLASLRHDVGDCIAFPGFIDAHVHYPQLRVMGSASGTLLDWLSSTVLPEEARFQNASYATSVAEAFTMSLARAGTTTAFVYSSSDAAATHVLFEAFRARGLRAGIGLVLMDQGPGPTVECRRALEEAEDLAAQWHRKEQDRLRFVVTPRFALSCSKALLEGAARLANDKHLPIQTHYAETEREGRETLLAHPWARDYLDVYDQCGLLSSRTLLAHAIHVSDRERARLVETGARIVHCPDSNRFLGSGAMDLARWTSAGVPVCLGSDVGAGRSLRIPSAVGHAFDTALSLGHRFTPDQLLRLATLEAARALGWEKETGSLEVGKDADVIVVRLPESSRGLSTDRALEQLAFSEGCTIERVYVRGRRIDLAD